MPTFELSDASGTYQVDAPDETAALSALHSVNGTNQPGIGEDLAKSAATVPGRIVAGVAGLPADLAHLYADKNDPNPLGSQAIREKLGSAYEAQREPGKLLQTAADLAPAVIGGPETMGAKLLTRVAAPAVASEAVGALTNDNPYAKVGAALVGGAGATAAARKFQQMGAARSAASAIPSGDKLVETGSDQFNQARSMDIQAKPDFAKKTAQEMRDAVQNYDPEQIKPVLNAIGRVEDLYKPGSPNPYNNLLVGVPASPVAMNEIELARKQLSGLRTSPDATLRTAAKAAQEAITKNQMGLTAADVLSGDAGLYSQTMRDAVGNYGAGKRSLVVQGKQALADLNAGTAGSGANIDNATRQAFKQLARPINNTNTPVWRKLGFNETEGAAIEKAATGTALGNTARYLGKGAPTGVVSAAGGLGIGHMAGGPVGAIALPAAAYVAKKIGDLSTKRAVSALDSLVRSRSPLAQQVAAQLPPQIVQRLPSKTQRILRGLAVTAPAVRNQVHQTIGQPVGQPATY